MKNGKRYEVVDDYERLALCALANLEKYPDMDRLLIERTRSLLLWIQNLRLHIDSNGASFYGWDIGEEEFVWISLQKDMGASEAIVKTIKLTREELKAMAKPKK